MSVKVYVHGYVIEEKRMRRFWLQTWDWRGCFRCITEYVGRFIGWRCDAYYYNGALVVDAGVGVAVGVGGYIVCWYRSTVAEHRRQRQRGVHL